MKLRGKVFITLRPTVMSPSGVGEGHLVTFVLAMPSTAVSGHDQVGGKP